MRAIIGFLLGAFLGYVYKDEIKKHVVNPARAKVDEIKAKREAAKAKEEPVKEEAKAEAAA